QRLPERGARRRVLRNVLARFLAGVDQDRRGLRPGAGFAARPFVIDDHGNLRVRIEREKLRALLLALLERDRMQLVGEAAFLERDARAHSVRRACGVEIDHGYLLGMRNCSFGGTKPATPWVHQPLLTSIT